VIRALLRLGLLGFGLGWVIDRVLTALAGGRPPAPVSSLVVVDAPIERVWRELIDIERQPRWMTEMKSVRVLTPGPVGVGTRGEATVRILGISVNDPVEVTEFTPPTRFAIRHEGTFSGHGVITLEAGPDGSTTIVRWDETLVAPALPHLWAEASRPVLSTIFQADLDRFRRLVEEA
jgi:uncharacterized membrane protein